MKIFSSLSNISTRDKNSKSEKVTYPYQESLQKNLDSVWICMFIAIPALMDVASSYWNPEEFFHPCNYANIISINDTLKIQSRFNKTKNEIDSYNSLLSLSETTVIDNEKYKLLLQNAIVESATLKKEFDYHKNHWKECFNQNLLKFDHKIIRYQLCIVTFGFGIVLYQIIKCFGYMSKIKNLNLTKKQQEAYAKDWKSLNAFKFKLICKCVVLCMLASLVVLFTLRFFHSSSRGVEMSFFI